jgi:glycosidase
MTKDPGSLRSWYATLIRLRAAHPALARGTIEMLDAGTSEVYASIRRTPGSPGILVLVNLGSTRHDGLTLGDDAPIRTLFGPQANRLSEIDLRSHGCGMYELAE